MKERTVAFHISHRNVYLVAGITSLLQFLFGTIAMPMTLCYINFLSQDVTDNLQELAEHISEAQITDENWKVITIQRINSFEGTIYLSEESLVAPEYAGEGSE